MSKHHPTPPERGRRRAALLLAALTATFAFASAASAAPTGPYAVFSDCPLATAGLTSCLYNQTTTGELAIGATTIPITSPITLQGGLISGAGGAETFVPAADGDTLSGGPQEVPGGLLGILPPPWFPASLKKKLAEYTKAGGPLAVTATLELVGPVQFNFINFLSESGTTAQLPLRLQLSNKFLGSACYIGSATQPLTLNLTTGTTSPPAPNTPITGTPGGITFEDGGHLIVGEPTELVDNAFSVPVANGCGGALATLIDPLVDLRFGLPSAAGKNTAILGGQLQRALAGAVKASE
jgi:hypothetical protein